MKNPLFLLLAFTLLVASLWKLAAHPKFSRMFRLLPLPFWCYFLPMCASTLGWFPAQSPLYPLLSQHLLPVCLVLLLIGTDLKALTRLGLPATLLMLAGSVGTIIGGMASFLLYRPWLPAESWGAIGALTGSWIGGSANLLAVKEALNVPDSLIGPIVIVDAAVAYSWMALLIWASTLQDGWEKFVSRWCPLRGDSTRASFGRPSVAESPRTGHRSANNLNPILPSGLVVGMGLSVAVSLIAQRLSPLLPVFGQIISGSTWTILLVTGIALGLSLTPLRRLEPAGLPKTGTFALYVLLASIGARANFKTVADAPVFLALGLTWILLHGICLLLAGLLLRAPLGLIATASQANIGGPISAPIVGATYHPRLASIGLLMAVLGNLLGTPLGLATAFLVRSLSA